METLKKYILDYIEKKGETSDREILISYTRKNTFWWNIDRRFEKQQSLWRKIKDMRQKGLIIETKRIEHKPKNDNVGISTTIFYKLKD